MVGACFSRIRSHKHFLSVYRVLSWPVFMIHIVMLYIWVAAFIFIGFSLQTDLVLAGGISLSDCEDYQYTINNGNQCFDCPACPAGQEYTMHCGYIEKNGNITRPNNNKECEYCPPNHYKSSKSQNMCDGCKRKCPKGKIMIHPCNKTHDMKCTKCPKGFFTESDGSCTRCSPCCGTPTLYTRDAVEKECEKAGMMSCSCRPLRCSDKKSAEDCKKGFLKFLTGSPSKKMSSPPTIISTTKKNNENNTTIKPKSPTGKTQKTTIPVLQSQNDQKKEDNEESFFTGWLVATVIGIVLLATIFFHMLKHFNILKRIKVLLTPRERDVEDDTSNSVITVEERFEAPAPPVITNYAQRILPEEEMESQSDHMMHDRSNVSTSDLDYDEFAYHDPWVYRDSTDLGVVQMRPMRWLPTRAEVAMNPEYGEYIEILRCEDIADDCLSTQGNNSGSLQQLDESSISREVVSNEPAPPHTEDRKEVMKVNLDNKPGQEHSDSEEPPTSIPATASGENTVIIATGQHRGMISDEFIRKEFSKGKRDKVSSNGKRRKKQPEKKKTRRTLDDNGLESEDVLRCTCGPPCSYRPYVRETKLCHCEDCVPQPTDDLYNIIERRCLRAEICKELNKKGVPNWRELCTYIRIDKEITSVEKEENPAEIVLNKLKTSRPRLKLEDFSLILNRIKRQDIMEMIMQHHVKCMLCRRNSFDGSLVNVHTVSDTSTTWIASKLSP